MKAGQFSDEQIVAELRWVIDCGEHHFGPERAARNLRKFYPWYLERLRLTGPDADRFQRAETLGEVREMLGEAAAAGRRQDVETQPWDREPASL